MPKTARPEMEAPPGRVYGPAMRTTRTAFVLPALVALSACSSAPPPPVPTEPTAAPSVAQPAAPKLDLSPVPVPAGIFATGRAKSVNATIASLGFQNAQKDMTTALVGALGGRRGLRLDIDAEKVASVIALDAPVDFIAAVNSDGPPEPVVGFAVGVKSLEDAKLAVGANRDFEPGMWAFGGERSKAFCVVAASAGPTPARIVCGGSERDVHTLGGYLTRTLPTQALPASDLTFELLVSPLNTRFGGDLAKLAPQASRLARSEMGIGEPQFDKALEVGASGLANEAIALLGDVDKVSFNVSLNPQGGVLVDATANYKSQKSWIAHNVAATQNGPLPGFFFRAPADADSVTYGMLRDPAEYTSILKVGKDLIEGGLTKAKVGSEAERKKVSAILDFPFIKGMQIVSASGMRRVTKSDKPSDKMTAMLESQMGWNVIGTNEKADTLIKWLKDGAAAYGQPGIQKEVKKKLEGFVPTVKTPAAPSKLGKGAFEMDVVMDIGGAGAAPPSKPVRGAPAKGVPAKGEANKGTSITMYVLVMSDGDTSWIAIGGNRDELVERLLEVKSGAAKDKTLDSRADVQGLKSQQVAAGGFFTVGSFRSLVNTLARSNSGDFDPSAPDPIFDGLPHKGQTPIVYQGAVTPSPLQTHFTLNVSKASLEDVTALVNAMKR